MVKGDIVLITFPFTDLSGSNSPKPPEKIPYLIFQLRHYDSSSGKSWCSSGL